MKERNERNKKKEQPVILMHTKKKVLKGIENKHTTAITVHLEDILHVKCLRICR